MLFGGAGDWGLLILRVALGIIFPFHGWLKIDPKGQVKGPAGFGALVKADASTAAAVLCMDCRTAGDDRRRPAHPRLGHADPALGFAIDMLVAIVLVKRGMQKAAFMDPQKGGWEFEFALMSAALALFFTGAGAISLDAAFGTGM